MTAVPAEAGATGEGYEALAVGDWERARAAFEAAVAAEDSPEALDGLGRALWWLRDSEGAVVQRERAYSGFRRDGELARAARIALWLSREYAVVWRNDAAANGWLARAERLNYDTDPEFSLLTHRYTAAMRVRMWEGLSASVGMTHQGAQLTQTRRTAVDAGISWALRKDLHSAP